MNRLESRSRVSLSRCNVIRAEKRFNLPWDRFIRVEVRVNLHRGIAIRAWGRSILFLAQMSLPQGRLTLHRARVDPEKGKLACALIWLLHQPLIQIQSLNAAAMLSS